MVARIRSKGTSVSIGCFGRHWNRRESEEKALLEELLSVWDVDENVAIYLYLLGSDVGPFWSQGFGALWQYLGFDVEPIWSQGLEATSVSIR